MYVLRSYHNPELQVGRGSGRARTQKHHLNQIHTYSTEIESGSDVNFVQTALSRFTLHSQLSILVYSQQ